MRQACLWGVGCVRIARKSGRERRCRRGARPRPRQQLRCPSAARAVRTAVSLAGRHALGTAGSLAGRRARSTAGSLAGRRAPAACNLAGRRPRARRAASLGGPPRLRHRPPRPRQPRRPGSQRPNRRRTTCRPSRPRPCPGWRPRRYPRGRRIPPSRAPHPAGRVPACRGRRSPTRPPPTTCCRCPCLPAARRRRRRRRRRHRVRRRRWRGPRSRPHGRRHRRCRRQNRPPRAVVAPDAPAHVRRVVRRAVLRVGPLVRVVGGALAGGGAPPGGRAAPETQRQ